jgi:chromosome segregation ATPase
MPPPDILKIPSVDAVVTLIIAILGYITILTARKKQEQELNEKRDKAYWRSRDEDKAELAGIREIVESVFKEQAAVKAQVQNSHGTGLRDDLDKVRDIALAAQQSAQAADSGIQRLEKKIDGFGEELVSSRREHEAFRHGDEENRAELRVVRAQADSMNSRLTALEIKNAQSHKDGRD